jgi:polar amino acid transport system permease protein
MQYDWNFAFLLQYKHVLISGLGVTLGFTVVTVLTGTLLGLTIGIARLCPVRVVTVPLTAFVELFRCTPLLVQLIWFYYAFPVISGISIPAYAAAVIGLSLYGAAFYSEVFRAGILSIERGQWDAARGLGMSDVKAMARVILPQAFKRMIPPFINQSVMQLKNTSLISTLAIGDLLYHGTLITAETYRPLEVYTVVALAYFSLLFPMTSAAQLLERRLSVSD